MRRTRRRIEAGGRRGRPGSRSQAAQSDAIHVLVYGDSLWAKRNDPFDCDLCSLFPEDVVVTNYAHAGARIRPRPDCDGFHQDVPVADDPGCRNGADRALRLQPDADPANDFCGARVEGQATCLEDQPLPPHDVGLLQFGTNDVRVDLTGPRWEIDLARYELWLEEILLAVPSESACVLVVPPPIWRAGYEHWNRRLAELAGSLSDAAERHGCELVDLLHTYLAIEAAEGEGATLPYYKDCAARGQGTDCIHYSIPPPGVAADAILDGIEGALGSDV